MRHLVKHLLVLLAILLAVAVTCLAYWPSESDAQLGPERVEEPLRLVEERSWDFEEAVERARAAERSVATPRATAESVTVEDEMYVAALRLRPSLERQPQHTRRVVGVLFEAAVEHDVDPFLALAFASRESGLRANVRGKLGEQGLLQLHGYARRVYGKGRDLGQPRANADAGMAYYASLRSTCARSDGTPETDTWILVAAYGTGKCLDSVVARRMKCGKRKRAELVRAVGEEYAATVWPM